MRREAYLRDQMALSELPRLRPLLNMRSEHGTSEDARLREDKDSAAHTVAAYEDPSAVVSRRDEEDLSRTTRGDEDLLPAGNCDRK